MSTTTMRLSYCHASVFAFFFFSTLVSVLVGGVNAEMNYEDSLALKHLFNLSSGSHWKTPWDVHEDLCSQHGIECDEDDFIIGLDLTDNSLSGELADLFPTGFVGLTRLGKLNLSRNKITGVVPVTLLQLTSLTDCDLSDNLLTGPLPVELQYIGKIVLAKNSLCPLPTNYSLWENENDLDEYDCECSKTPCRNGGVCIAEKLKPCKCIAKYFGSHCEKIDYCFSNPCLNSGECTLANDKEGFICTCPSGYHGPTCESKSSSWIIMAVILSPIGIGACIYLAFMLSGKFKKKQAPMLVGQDDARGIALLDDEEDGVYAL